MNITDLANTLNSLAKHEAYSISQLPTLRKKFLKKTQLPDAIFHPRTIFDGDRYAFHYGGRDEMQFNVGEDFVGGRIITRFCLAFSLEPSRSLPNPQNVLRPFWTRFKKCLAEHPDKFKGFKLWYQSGLGDERGSTGFFDVEEIRDDLFSLNSFICIGSYLEGGISKRSVNDLKIILNGLDSLLPIYCYCVLNQKNAFETQSRFARVCWNENDWTSPSGPFGKSKDKGSHEFKYGYGHEEWAFDFTKPIGGYHYCLLQSVETGRESFLGKKFNVKLYSYNSDNKEFFWIGYIKELEVLSKEVAKEIFHVYENNGWLKEMAKEIDMAGGDSDKFLNIAPAYHFNVRFRPEDAQLYAPREPFENFHELVNTHHYQFIKATDSAVDKSIENRDSKLTRSFRFKYGGAKKNLSVRKSNRQAKLVEIKPIHDEIQECLFNLLVHELGDKNVSKENDTGMQTRIDIVVKSNEGFKLYEVKSYSSVMISIRMALGQLLEYSFWPSPIEKISDLVVVSHLVASKAVEVYLETLRKLTGLQIYYQQFDLETKTLCKKI